MSDDESPFRPEHFRKYDESDDARFYVEPRFVAHIDDTAIAALSEYYAEVLKPEDRVLDLMSSWISHLPAGYQPARAVGLGMNADELSRNPALDDWWCTTSIASRRCRSTTPVSTRC